MKLHGKTAIVTGAAHGIGKAIAESFAREGAFVWLVDLDAKAGKKTGDQIIHSGRQAQFVRCDVSSASQVLRVVKLVSEESGGIDILCNNAAFISPKWHNAADAPESEWEKCFQVSLMGTQLFTKSVLPLMVRRKHGSIINISSVQGLVGGRNSVAYTTIKHALIGFTRSVAYDFGAQNIRCNVICPGAIRTRISPKPGSELHQRQIGKTFLGRIGEPGEVAQAAVFLGSDDSSYVTGAVLAVDGGWTAM
ncbi:MAG TPA: SDR family oxidoreductase [Candidatus Dormibacteraeota bacterium]|nr:SDR family oxidoreductase [Candidatus Dormibacteraeota bacterium]